MTLMTPSDLICSLFDIVGINAAQTYARIIMRHLKGWSPVDFAVHISDDFSPFIVSEINKILARLKNNEPIQYIVGEEYFCGHYFKTEPGVLIPRPETQELVDLIIDKYKEKSDLRILDLCTGSGCIAISLALALPFSTIEGIDISEKAILLSQENARRLKAKIDVKIDDIFSFIPSHKNFDIIVSNPPYIARSESVRMDNSVLDYEPEKALFVPDDNPLVFYRRICEIASSSLRPGGTLWLEINPVFAEELQVLIQKFGFKNVEIIRDFYGKLRFAFASLPEND